VRLLRHLAAAVDGLADVQQLLRVLLARVRHQRHVQAGAVDQLAQLAHEPVLAEEPVRHRGVGLAAQQELQVVDDGVPDPQWAGRGGLQVAQHGGGGLRPVIVEKVHRQRAEGVHHGVDGVDGLAVQRPAGELVQHEGAEAVQRHLEAAPKGGHALLAQVQRVLGQQGGLPGASAAAQHRQLVTAEALQQGVELGKACPALALLLRVPQDCLQVQAEVAGAVGQLALPEHMVVAQPAALAGRRARRSAGAVAQAVAGRVAARARRGGELPDAELAVARVALAVAASPEPPPLPLPPKRPASSGRELRRRCHAGRGGGFGGGGKAGVCGGSGAPHGTRRSWQLKLLAGRPGLLEGPGGDEEAAAGPKEAGSLGQEAAASVSGGEVVHHRHAGDGVESGGAQGAAEDVGLGQAEADVAGGPVTGAGASRRWRPAADVGADRQVAARRSQAGQRGGGVAAAEVGQQAAGRQVPQQVAHAGWGAAPVGAAAGAAFVRAGEGGRHAAVHPVDEPLLQGRLRLGGGPLLLLQMKGNRRASLMQRHFHKLLSKSQSLSMPVMSERKAVIKNADMSEDMQQDAVDCATQAMEKFNVEKDIAAYIKKEFDKKYNPTWHCIVGRNFGSYVTHETKHFIYFYLGQMSGGLFPKLTSKVRRESINREIVELKKCLPLPRSITKKLSYLHILSLTNTYLKKLMHMPPTLPLGLYDQTAPSNAEACAALDFFFVLMNQQLEILYISDNCNQFLPKTNTELMAQCRSLDQLLDLPTNPEQLLDGQAAGNRELAFLVSQTARQKKQPQQQQTGENDENGGGDMPAPTAQNVTLSIREVTSPHLTYYEHPSIQHQHRLLLAECRLLQEESAGPAPAGTLDLLTLHELDMRLRSASQLFLDHFPGLAAGHSWYRLLHPGDLSLASRMHAEALASPDRQARAALRLLRPDGQPGPACLAILRAVLDSTTGAVTGLRCSYRLAELAQLSALRLFTHLNSFRASANQQLSLYRSLSNGPRTRILDQRLSFLQSSSSPPGPRGFGPPAGLDMMISSTLSTVQAERQARRRAHCFTSSRSDRPRSDTLATADSPLSGSQKMPMCLRPAASSAWILLSVSAPFRQQLVARVFTTASRALAKREMAYCSRPGSASAAAASFTARAASVAPPPDTKRGLRALTPSSTARSRSSRRFSVLARSSTVEILQLSSWKRRRGGAYPMVGERAEDALTAELLCPSKYRSSHLEHHYVGVADLLGDHTGAGAHLFRGRRGEARQGDGASGGGQAAQVELGGHPQSQDVVVVQVVQGQLAHLAAAHHNPGPGFGQAAHLGLHDSLLLSREVGQLGGRLHQHGALGLRLQEVHRAGEHGHLDAAALRDHLGDVALGGPAEHHAADEAGAVNGAAQHLADAYAVHIEVATLGQHADAGLADQAGQAFVQAELLGHHGAADQRLHLSDVANRFLIAGHNLGGAEAHAQHALGLLKQEAGQHEAEVGAVAGLLLLLLAGQHQHLGGRMGHLQLLQHGGGVLGDEVLADVIDDNLVHADWPVAGAGHAAHLAACLDVAEHGLVHAGVVPGALLHHGVEAGGSGNVQGHCGRGTRDDRARPDQEKTATESSTEQKATAKSSVSWCASLLNASLLNASLLNASQLCDCSFLSAATWLTVASASPARPSACSPSSCLTTCSSVLAMTGGTEPGCCCCCSVELPTAATPPPLTGAARLGRGRLSSNADEGPRPPCRPTSVTRRELLASSADRWPARGCCWCPDWRLGGDGAVVAAQRVDEAALQQVVQAQGGVVAGGQQEVAAGMEGDAIGGALVHRVVLHQLVHADVPDLHGPVRGGRGHTVAGRVELHIVDQAAVLLEGADAVLRLAVPQAHGFVIRAGHDEAALGAEPSALHPVHVAAEGEQELLPLHSPHFHGLVVRAGEQPLVVGGEVNGPHAGRVATESGALAFDARRPQANGFVARGGGDQLAGGGEADAHHGLLVAHEAEGAGLRPEVPYGEVAIQRAGHQLLAVGREVNAGDGVLVALEMDL
uniref:BHLH domain-containing protein n=1 Tax=Macrostomum lignano TaxID=282301 RepID=A0A1I8IGQ7_9PLAT